MTAEEIFQWAGSARRGNRAYLSNAYYTVTQLKAFLAENHVQILSNEDMLLLLQKDDGLYRLQFYARSADALRSLPELLPPLDAPLVVDLVGREPAVGQQAQQVLACDFSQYSVFVRMVCREHTLPRADGMERVEPASESDVSKVYAMISGEFDPLFAHIPTEAELLRAVQNGEITVIRDGEKLAGMAFFEKESDKYFVLRYFIVDAGYRGQNIAGALMRHKFVNSPDDAVYMLWVGTYNSAQTLYKKFGFQYDGLTDYILKYDPAP